MLYVRPERKRGKRFESNDTDHWIAKVSQRLLFLGGKGNLLIAKFVRFPDLCFLHGASSVICGQRCDALSNLRLFASKPDIATPRWLLTLE